MPALRINLSPLNKINVRRLIAQSKIPSEGFDEWLDERAREMDCDADDLRQYILEEQERLSILTSVEQRTVTQTVAMKAGLTRAKTLRRINEGLDATQKIVRVDRKGEVTYDEEVADWAMRNKAIDHSRAVLGMDAPRAMSIEHDVTDRVASLTQAQITTRLLELAKGNKELEQQLAGSLRITGGIAGEEGAPGQVVLDAELHEDKGRAG